MITLQLSSSAVDGAIDALNNAIERYHRMHSKAVGTQNDVLAEMLARTIARFTKARQELLDAVVVGVSE